MAKKRRVAEAACRECGTNHDPNKSDCPVRCPACGNTDDPLQFDVLGADANKVFCIRCHTEFDPSDNVVKEVR